MFVPIMNTYLDDMEYDINPMKVNINEYYYRMNPNVATYQFVKTSMNYAILKDSWWMNFFSQRNETYI